MMDRNTEAIIVTKKVASSGVYAARSRAIGVVPRINIEAVLGYF